MGLNVRQANGLCGLWVSRFGAEICGFEVGMPLYSNKALGQQVYCSVFRCKAR